MKLYVKLLFLVGGWVVGEKKTKLMLYSTQVEVEVGVELGNRIPYQNCIKIAFELQKSDMNKSKLVCYQKPN